MVLKLDHLTEKVNTNGTDCVWIAFYARRNSSSKQRCRNSYIIMSSILKVDTIQGPEAVILLSVKILVVEVFSALASSSAQ